MWRSKFPRLITKRSNIVGQFPVVKFSVPIKINYSRLGGKGRARTKNICACYSSYITHSSSTYLRLYLRSTGHPMTSGSARSIGKQLLPGDAAHYPRPQEPGVRGSDSERKMRRARLANRVCSSTYILPVH